MRTQVANKLVIPSTHAVYSQAVPMSGGNAISVDLTVFTGSGVRVEYQVGNDLENWDAVAFIISTVGVGYHYGDTTASIAGAVVRLKFTASATSVVDAGIATASL